MNLGVDCREKVPSLSPSILPLLVLVKEWSEFKEDAFLQTHLILVLLQGVQALSEGSGKEPCPKVLEQRLQEIGGEALSHRFTKTLTDVSQELTSFMDLFDHLGKLFTPANENSPPLLDADCKNSVLGTFIRHCVLEYKKLTFSQLVRFHGQCLGVLKEEEPRRKASMKAGKESLLSQKDFTAALRNLTLSAREKGTNGDLHDNHELGSEALKLAELHGQFGHQEEGTFALHEAIRLAMQNKHESFLLEHTMAWLHKLQPFNGEDSLIILNRFIENAWFLVLPLLRVWGKLQLTKSQFALAQEPTKVLQTLLTGEVDFSPVYMYDDRREKLAQKSSSLALQAGLWDQYGQRLLGLLYSQLQCHMTSCDLPLEEEKEAFSLSVCTMARHLAETGKFESSQALLATTRKHFSGTGIPYKLLCQCEKETTFDRAVLECDFDSARRHLREIATLDKHSASYRSAVLAKAEGNLHSALEQAQHLLTELQRSKNEPQNHIILQTSLLILLAEVHMAQGFPAMALPHILKCISLCDQHHLPSCHANLCLAEIQLQLASFPGLPPTFRTGEISLGTRLRLTQASELFCLDPLQLQLGSPKDCLALVKECLLHCQANSPTVDRGTANLLLTQATLCSAKQTSEILTKEDVLGVIPVLVEAVANFRQCSARQRLKMALILQAQLYNFIGYLDERDKTSKLIVKLESNIIL